MDKRGSQKGRDSVCREKIEIWTRERIEVGLLLPS